MSLLGARRIIDARERFLSILHIWQLDLWAMVWSLFFQEQERKCLWLCDVAVAGVRECPSVREPPLRGAPASTH